MSTERGPGESPGLEQPTTSQHPDLSRRSVIRGAAGLAGAGLAAGAFTGAIATSAQAAAARPARPAQQAPGKTTEPVIVHIRDVSSGEMDVFAGTSHTRLRDPGLAARFVRGVS